MRIFLIRHCQSKANAKRVYNSTMEKDDGLSELGKKQATEIGRYFRGINLQRVYSSPFLRTRQTAEAIASISGSGIEIVDEFRELDCGQWNGKSEMEIRSAFPEAWKGWHDDPQNNPIPGGESLLDVEARSISALRRIVKENDYESIAIVTHYCVFNVIVCSMVSSLANFRCFDTGNGTIAEMAMENVPRLNSYYNIFSKDGKETF